MAQYIDAFVAPVPRKNLAAYRRMSRKSAKIWREHGAIQYVECIADDVKKGKVTSFPRSVNLKPSEVVVFGWIVFESRTQRNRAMKNMMADKRLKSMMDPKTMPFDGMRLIYGGFKQFIAA